MHPILPPFSYLRAISLVNKAVAFVGSPEGGVWGDGLLLQIDQLFT
jgi:hypothetical protein